MKMEMSSKMRAKQTQKIFMNLFKKKKLVN